METEYKTGEEIFELILAALNNPDKRIEILNGEVGLKCYTCQKLVLTKQPKRYINYPTCSLSCFGYMVRSLKLANIIVPKIITPPKPPKIGKTEWVCKVCGETYYLNYNPRKNRRNACSSLCHRRLNKNEIF